MFVATFGLWVADAVTALTARTVGPAGSSPPSPPPPLPPARGSYEVSIASVFENDCARSLCAGPPGASGALETAEPSPPRVCIGENDGDLFFCLR